MFVEEVFSNAYVSASFATIFGKVIFVLFVLDFVAEPGHSDPLLEAACDTALVLPFLRPNIAFIQAEGSPRAPTRGGEGIQLSSFFPNTPLSPTDINSGSMGGQPAAFSQPAGPLASQTAPLWVCSGFAHVVAVPCAAQRGMDPAGATALVDRLTVRLASATDASLGPVLDTLAGAVPRGGGGSTPTPPLNVHHSPHPDTTPTPNNTPSAKSGPNHSPPPSQPTPFPRPCATTDICDSYCTLRKGRVLVCVLELGQRSSRRPLFTPNNLLAFWVDGKRGAGLRTCDYFRCVRIPRH